MVISISIANLILFNSGNSFGGDFVPPAPSVASHRVSNAFSDQERFKVIDNNVNRFIRRNSLAGASVSVVKDGKLVFTKGYGFADKEKSTHIQPYNLFRIASVSKLVTAVAIMKLVEQGKLELNSKVFGADGVLNDSIYLNYRDAKVEKITVKHLLNHSAGFTNRYGDPMFMPTVIAKKMKIDYPIEQEEYHTVYA